MAITATTNNYYHFNASSHPKATVLYGIGYFPLPLPFLDVYGKAGVARSADQSHLRSCPTYSAGGGVVRQPAIP